MTRARAARADSEPRRSANREVGWDGCSGLRIVREWPAVAASAAAEVFRP